MDGEGEWPLEVRSIAGSAPVFFPWPMPLNDDKESTNELIETIRLACQDERETLPQLVQELDQILRDSHTKSYQSMKQVCDRYNQVVDEILEQDPDVRHRLRSRPSVSLLRHIIQQCYNRAVVDPEKLNQYEPFSAGVYGETSFELIDQMINTISLTENDIFIDLGSGVGQVVLQVAAATNCKSCIGIEKANWPAQYAEQMTYEFRRWMDFYGKTYSDFELLKGDFLSEEHRATINFSTVLFVNNFAFGPEVDLQLKERFHDLKEGSKIVSSREFRPMNMQISERNLSDVGAILEVRELSPLRGPVSWTHKPVSYFLHTVDRTQLENYYFLRRNGIKLVDQPKKEVQRSKTLRDGQNNKIAAGRQRMAQRKKHLRFQRYPSRDHEWQKAFPGAYHSALKLPGTAQVAGKATFMRDAETTVKYGMSASRSLHFSRKEDLPVKRNGTHPQSKAGTEITTVLKERLEKHIQRLKMSSGISIGDVDGQRLPMVSKESSTNREEEKVHVGKRKRPSEDTPEPKRRKPILAEESRSITSRENSAKFTRSIASSAQPLSDALRVVQATDVATTPGKRNGIANELADLRILRSLLVVDGAFRARKEKEMTRNVRKVRTKNTELPANKKHRPVLPLSCINGNRQEEQDVCGSNRPDRPCKSNSRWLFDIRLAPSPHPQCKHDEEIGAEVEDPVAPSTSNFNEVSEKINHGSKSDKSGRIEVDSHPSHANRGFLRMRNRCKRRTRSDESNVTAVSNEDFNAGSEKETLETSIGSLDYFHMNIAPERKTAKKTGDGSTGTHLPVGPALLSNLDESLWEPCWTEDEFEQEELDEALEILHQETDNVTKTNLSNSDKFNIEWMNQKARNVCRPISLPETESISSSSDIAGPPEFFPLNNTGASAWLPGYLKRDDESEYKPQDWFPACAEQEAKHKPIYVSLPRDVLHRKFKDMNTGDPANVPSIPISLPREAALFDFKSQFSPKLQFGSESHPSPKLSPRRTVMRSDISLTASDEMELWNVSKIMPCIPVSLPKEALSIKEESEAVGDKNPAYDAADSRSCSSFTGSTMSYGDSPVIDSHLRAETADVLENKHQTSLVDECEIPPALQALLGSFKSLYMNFLKYKKSPSYQSDIIAKIEAEKSRKTAALSLESELSHQISQLEEENAQLLRIRMTEVGMTACNKVEFFEEANRLVLRNKFLQVQALYLHHQVALEQEKLFKKYEESCCDQLVRHKTQDIRDQIQLSPEPSLEIADVDSPSFCGRSVGDSPQVLDVALLESRTDSPHDKSAESCNDAPADPSDPCDVMPKLNLSIDYSKDDEVQTEEDNARSGSRSVSPEPDMPLLMPELESRSSTEQSPVVTQSVEDTTSSCCMMSIPVKLPLRKLMRTKKPANLNLTPPPKREENPSPAQGDASGQLLQIPASPRCPPLENDRLNMYSPISRASSVENLVMLEDQGEPGNNLMQCFSPISSPASVRSMTSERLCFPSDGDAFVPPQMETVPLQSLGTGYRWQSIDRWRLLSSEPVESDVKFPWPTTLPLQPCSSDRETLVMIGGEQNSIDELGSICSRLPTKQSNGQVEDGQMSFIGGGESLEDMTSSASLLKRNTGSGGPPPLNFERCISAPMDNRPAKPVSMEEQNVVNEQCRPQCRPRRRKRSRATVAKPLVSPEGFHDVAAAVCRRLGQNSPRHTANDLARPLDSRSDSRDSGLGKESEIDYERLLSLRNGHVISTALDSGVSSPRILVNRTLGVPQHHPLTPLAGLYPWQPNLHSHIGNSSVECNGDFFERKTFDKSSSSYGNFPKDPNRRTTPVSMPHDNSQSLNTTTFGQTTDCGPPSGLPLSAFQLSQNDVFDIRDGRGDLNRFLGSSSSLGNYFPIERSPDLAVMNRHQAWVSKQPSAAAGRTPQSPVADLSAAKNLSRSNTKPLDVEHFSGSKLFDSTTWPSYLTKPSQECYDQNRQFLNSKVLQHDSYPAPNTRLGLEPGFSPPYFNHPSSCGFTRNVPFDSYSTHYFGGAPAFHGISSNHQLRRKTPNGFGYRQNGFY